MVMNLAVHATPSLRDAQEAHRHNDRLGVHLFASGSPDLPGLGPWLADFVRRDLPAPPSVLAWDFLSIALAAFAADRMLLRDGAPDGWTRNIGLDVALAEPAPWEPVLDKLERAFRFLTGDIWHLSVRSGGHRPPQFEAKMHDRDQICLFSGGLDSFLGALQLVNQGARPLLVSQGSPKEITPQTYLAHKLGLKDYRFEGRVSERWYPPYEGTTRARSILFFAYGLVAASACGLNEVTVPENALIAINPPFTRRRLGSLSTRTTHPHFMGLINQIWNDAGLAVGLRNPFFATTKGEMLQTAIHPRLSHLASQSYSCGKGKRKNGQCGRCVPCLIRRASFNGAGVVDQTRYLNDLEDSVTNDDVIAARQAVARHDGMHARTLARWVQMSGPLPTDPAIRNATIAAVGRGLAELRELFNHTQWP
jgi:hypothetical protein